MEFGSLTWDLALRMVAAPLLVLPIALDRELNSRIMGLRTFPLVALGASGFVVLGQTVGSGGEDPEVMGRIVQGLMTGIGFVGGGAILKNDDNVKGTASAASIWVTGALGLACGLGEWGLALTLAAINFLILFGFSRIKSETG